MPWRRQGTGKATEHYYAKQVDYVQRNRKVKENYAKPLDKACHRKSRGKLCQADGRRAAGEKSRRKLCQAMGRGTAKDRGKVRQAMGQGMAQEK